MPEINLTAEMKLNFFAILTDFIQIQSFDVCCAIKHHIAIAHPANNKVFNEPIAIIIPLYFFKGRKRIVTMSTQYNA